MKKLKYILFISFMFLTTQASASGINISEIRSYFIKQGYTQTESVFGKDENSLQDQLGSIIIKQYEDKSIREIMFFVKRGDDKIRKKAVVEGKWLLLKLSSNNKEISKWFDGCISGAIVDDEIIINNHKYACVDFGDQIMFGY